MALENRLTPMGKRPRLSSGGGLALTVTTPHLKTPKHVLQDMIESRDVTEEMAARALCSCVVSAAQGEGQDEALDCLEDLLEQGLDPNITSQQVMSKVGGTPLFLAAKLNVPQAVRLLCLHGASMVQGNASEDNLTPLEVAIANNCAAAMDEMFGWIRHLERKFQPDSSALSSADSSR